MTKDQVRYFNHRAWFSFYHAMSQYNNFCHKVVAFRND